MKSNIGVLFFSSSNYMVKPISKQIIEIVRKDKNKHYLHELRKERIVYQHQSYLYHTINSDTSAAKNFIWYFKFKNLYSHYYKPFKIRLMCDSFTKAISDDTDFSTSLASLRE